MVSKKQVAKVIDLSESTFKTCLDNLDQIKNIRLNKRPDLAASGMLNFQILLARRLYAIEEQYRITKKEFRILNKRRQFLSTSYFKKRSTNLTNYLDALNQCIRIGKEIGDCFAWFFYHRDQDLLDEHLKNENDAHPTFGFGGKAEIEFLTRGAKIGDNYFTLYHGVTNYLRNGDFTIINLKTLRVNEIVELKSKRIHENCMELRLFSIGKNKSFIDSLSSGVKVDTEKNLDNEVYIERLEKQMNRISETIKHQKLEKDDKPLLWGSNYLYDLESKLISLTANQFHNFRVGKGHVCTYYKSTKKLSSILLNGYSVTNTKMEEIHRMMNEIQTELKELNHSLVSTTLYHTNNYIMPGTMPMYWHRINSKIIHDLYLQKSILNTIYNPAHFLKKLIEIGFTYETKGKNLIIKKEIGSRTMVLKRYMFFVDLISMKLFKEDTIAEMLKTLVKKIENNEIEADEITLKMSSLFQL